MGFSVIDKLGQQKQTIAPLNLSGTDVTGVLPASAVDVAGGVGIVAETGTRTYAARTLSAGASITISNPAGTAGNPLIAFARTKLATSVTGSQNNYAPGISGDTAEFWSGASDATFTGLASGVTGQLYFFKNVGSHNAFFTHQSGSSSAGNKFTNLITSVNTAVGVGGSAAWIYDGTNWQLIHHFQGNTISYTPSWTTSGTAPALNNGTLTGSYLQNGLKVQFLVTLTMGSTTTFGTGNYQFSVPFNIVASQLDICQGAHGGVGNNGVSSFQTASTFDVFNAGNGAVWTNINPATWVSTDVLTMQATATVS